jgi:DeoR/GlpR family transcriptional regulator of sugar metabolism
MHVLTENHIILHMLKEERFRYILTKISEDQKVTLKSLSNDLNVSDHTIRRDLKELTNKGLLTAVRGGALPPTPTPTPHHFLDRLNYKIDEKKAIAEKAVKFIRDGQVIVLDGGTTALNISGLLSPDLKLTVVTNSFPVVTVLEAHPNIDVLFAGGRLHKGSFTSTGYDTIRFFNNIRADIYFMGICALHPTSGVTTISYEESEVKKAIVEVSKQVIAVTPHDRLNSAEAFFICPLSSVDAIITDGEGAETMEEFSRQVGIEVI